MAPQVSVIIPTCNRPDMLAVCLDALKPQAVDAASLEVAVCVTDDSPGDDTKRMIEDRYAWVSWQQGPRRGPAANRNAGARSAQGDVLVFLDDDCIPEPHWLATLVAPLMNGETLISEGATSADRPFGRHDEEAPINLTGGYLWSCNFAIARPCFEALNGFDEAFPAAAMEDVDFRMRLLKAGHSLRFVRDAEVVHPVRRIKGGEFMHARGKSFLLLAERHPDILGGTRLWVALLCHARMLWHCLRAVPRLGVGGLPLKLKWVSLNYRYFREAQRRAAARR